MKAPRNKTIDISIDEWQNYLARCIELSTPAEIEQLLNKSILGDSMAVMPLLPRAFADLVIVDPPYNLAKDFGGAKFKKLSDEEYEKYTESWLLALLPLMKENASIYVCCDWLSSTAIGRVLKRHLHVQNRICWQREKGRGAKNNWKNCTEDIWFATVSDDYTFNIEDVKIKRKVIPNVSEEDVAQLRLPCTPQPFWKTGSFLKS